MHRAEAGGTDRPAGESKLLVDELACVTFADLDHRRGRIGCDNELREVLGRLGNGLSLQRLQSLR